MWARVEDRDGKLIVAEIIDFDPADKFHPDLHWVEIPSGVNVGEGYIYDGGMNTFSPPPPPPPITVKIDMLDTAPNRVLAKVYINKVNELRIQMGLPAITMQEFEDAVKTELGLSSGSSTGSSIDISISGGTV